MSNAGLFASVAREYANFRPGYPPELFVWLARASPARGAVWDCGCGSGQASVALAQHFGHVFSHRRVGGADCGRAAARARALLDRSGRRSRSRTALRRPGDGGAGAALVRCGSLLYRGKGVARTGALLAVWNYPRPELIDSELDRIFLDFYRDVVGPYWPPNGGTSRLTTRLCRSLSRNCRTLVWARCSNGISNRYWATSAAGPPPRAIARRWARIRAAACAPRWVRHGRLKAPRARIRLPIGLRVARLA